MPESDDPLASEVSIGVELDKQGFSAKFRSRAVAALDRLFGGLIDIVGSRAESLGRIERAKTDAKVLLIKREAEATSVQLSAASEADSRALKRLLDQQQKKQQNLDAVAQETLSEIKALPPPKNVDAGPDEVDPDWMNVFVGHAGNASSEHLRRMWARILAGEIKEPGSFGRSTLRAIAELDKPIAELFQQSIENRFIGGLLPIPELSGKALFEMNSLEEVGLVGGVSASILQIPDIEKDGFCYIRNSSRALRIKAKPGHKITLRVAWLSRVGKEIASILPSEPVDIALRAAAKFVNEEAESCDLGTMVASAEGSGSVFRFDEKLY